MLKQKLGCVWVCWKSTFFLVKSTGASCTWVNTVIFSCDKCPPPCRRNTDVRALGVDMCAWNTHGGNATRLQHSGVLVLTTLFSWAHLESYGKQQQTTCPQSSSVDGPDHQHIHDNKTVSWSLPSFGVKDSMIFSHTTKANTTSECVLQSCRKNDLDRHHPHLTPRETSVVGKICFSCGWSLARYVGNL